MQKTTELNESVYKNTTPGLRGEVVIERWEVQLDSKGVPVLDVDGNAIPVTLIDEQTHRNTWTYSAFQFYGTGSGYRSMLFPYSGQPYIFVASLANNDPTKTMFTRLPNGMTTGVAVPGGDPQDSQFVTVDAVTERYTLVRNFNPPSVTQNIDLIGLIPTLNNPNNPIAYVVLPATCIQSTTTLLKVYYRLYHTFNSDIVDQNTFFGTDRYMFNQINQNRQPYVDSVYNTYQQNPANIKYCSNTSGGNNALTYNTTGLSSSNALYNYQDVSVGYTLSSGIGNTNAMGRIVGSAVHFVGNKNKAIAQVATPTPLQNIIGHAASALGPGKDINNLPSSTGTIAIDASSYQVDIPKFYAVTITTSGEASDASATYQVYTKPQVGYQYNSTLQQLQYNTGYESLVFPPPVPGGIPPPSSNYYGDLNSIHKFLNPYGATSQPGGSGNPRQFDMNLIVLSDLEIISYDMTGITTINISQTPSYVNYDANSSSPLILSGAGIRQVAADKTNRVIYAACGVTGLAHIDVASGTVTTLAGPTGAGIDGTQCYSVFFNNEGAGNQLWAVFAGCIALSTDGGSTWTNYIPANVITGLNDTQANWSNVLQLVVDEFDASKRMALFTSSLGLVWYTVAGSGSVAANNLVVNSSMNIDTNTVNFYNRFRFSNDGNLYGMTATSSLYVLSYSSFGSTSTTSPFITGMHYGSGPVVVFDNAYVGSAQVTGKTSPLLCLEKDSSGILRPIFTPYQTNGYDTGAISPYKTYTLDVAALATTSIATTNPVTTEINSSLNSSNQYLLPLMYGFSVKISDGVYFSFSPYSNGYYLCTPNAGPTYNNQSNYLFGGLVQYGWDGTNWVAGNTGSKPVHTTPQAIPGGLLLSFQDTQPTGNFVATDYYSTHVAKGILVDEITGFSFNTSVMGSPMKMQNTDIQVSTIPSPEGVVSNESISWTNFAPFASTSQPDPTNWGWPLMGTPGLAVGSNNSMAWSDQRFDSGDFDVTWTVGRFATTSSQNFIVGLVPDANLVNNTTVSIASSELAKYQGTSANMDFAVIFTGTSGTSATTLNAKFNVAATNITTTPIQPYGTDGRGAAVTCELRRSGTTLTWSINGSVISTQTISATTPYRIVISESNCSGTFAKSMKAIYTNSTRNVVSLGIVTNNSGRYDPLFWRCPSYTVNVNSMYDVTIDGTSATVITDGITAPAAGQVTLCSGMGKLWFNSADAGKAITANYPYQVTPE